MKKIAVISDTHIPKAAADLPPALYDELAKVDLILHAGDFVEMALLKKLRDIAPTRAVHGNMDMNDLKVTLPDKEIIKVEKFKIGLIHGYGPPGMLVETISKEFRKVDCIVFGHSHTPMSQIIKKTLFFNPGTPTDKIFAPYNTFGILEVGDSIEGKIVKLSA